MSLTKRSFFRSLAIGLVSAPLLVKELCRPAIGLTVSDLDKIEEALKSIPNPEYITEMWLNQKSKFVLVDFQTAWKQYSLHN